MARDVERGPVSEEGSLAALTPRWSAADVLIDPWTGLSHKALLGPSSKGARQGIAPTWVGSHTRRLNAYRVLAAYLANVARAFLPSTRAPEDIDDHREYGDAATLRDQVVAAVLGEEPSIMVDGAGVEPHEPEDPGEDATPEERAAFTAARAEFEKASAEFEAARQLQEWVDAWVDKARFHGKMLDYERDAVGLGDGVMLLSWSNRRGRVKATVYDPGFYFPVLSTSDDDDYPDRVHLAWEEEDESDPSVKWVHRVTYEIVELPDGQTRSYPWHGPDDEPSRYRTLLTEARWRWDDLGDRTVDDFSFNRAEFLINEDGEELREFDTGIDFIPVVHLPTTVTKHHFGESVLMRVAQLLDDLQSAYTDLAISADLNAAPPLVVKGRSGSVGTLSTYGPRTVLYADGGGELLDTSEALDALLKNITFLHDTLSVNARVPAAILGRIDPSKIEAGVILLLTFAPFKSLIGEMRLVRAQKYPLIFDFVQRLAMVGKGTRNGADRPGRTLPAGPTRRVEVKFGSYVPLDTSALVEMYRGMLVAHGMSRQTFLRLVDAAGIDVGDDLAAELERIEHEDFEGAKNIADATSDEAAAGRYLGLEVEEAEPERPVPAPGAAGGEGGAEQQ